jgi:hypothetical protein
MVIRIRSLSDWLERAGQPDDAARLDGWSTTKTVPTTPLQLARHDRTIAHLTESLGTDRLVSRQAEGRACTTEEIVAIALAAIDRVTSQERQNIR